MSLSHPSSTRFWSGRPVLVTGAGGFIASHLVETLAHRLAMTLIEEFGIAWIRMSLNKPGAIRGSRDVGVTIERRKA